MRLAETKRGREPHSSSYIFWTFHADFAYMVALVCIGDFDATYPTIYLSLLDIMIEQLNKYLKGAHVFYVIRECICF